MDIENKIITLLSDLLKIDKSELNLEKEIGDIQKWDSMMNVIILSSLEETFDVMIPEEDLFDLVTIGAIVEEIKKLKQ